MPKVKHTPIDTKDKLERLLNKKDIVLSDSLPNAINQLVEAIDSLLAGRAWIDAQPARGTLPYNKRNALDDIDNAVTALRSKLDDRKALRQKQLNFANRTVVPNATGEYAGNGKFYIQFVNIGMGDCTLITTPKGVKIMVDCGSDGMKDVTSPIPGYDPTINGSAEKIVGDAIKSKTFLNGSGGIDILVLTHPDGDHHNKLRAILKDKIGGSISVKVVYYGGVRDSVDEDGHVKIKIGADGLAAFHPSSVYITEIAGKTNGELRRVDLQFNDNAAEVKKMINGDTITATSGTANQIGKEYIDRAGEIVLYYEDGDSDFRLSALASNVTGYWDEDNDYFGNDADLKGAKEMKLDGEEPNKRCLVVMVRCFGQNALVCGDATVVTEKFMLRFFKNSLQTVQTLRMGHHGSPTSSCADFVNALTAMNLAVASTGGQVTVKHHLPKKPILDLYNIDRIPNDARAHDIWAYVKDADSKAQNHFPGITRKLFATGSNDTVSIWSEKNT